MIPAQLAAFLLLLIDHPTLLLLTIMAIVMIVETALDFVPTVPILTPILMPIVKQVYPVYFACCSSSTTRSA